MLYLFSITEVRFPFQFDEYRDADFSVSRHFLSGHTGFHKNSKVAKVSFLSKRVSFFKKVALK